MACIVVLTSPTASAMQELSVWLKRLKPVVRIKNLSDIVSHILRI